jgi:serine acetyltransferase
MTIKTKMKTKLSLLTGLVIMAVTTTAQAAEYSPLVFASTYVSAGASSNFGGDIVANTYLVVGADTTVSGSIQTGTAITIGAASLVG